MGRIKSTAIKTLGKEIIAEHGEKFSKDFGKNKKALEGIKKIRSKRTRNILAGFITRKMKSAGSGSSE